VSAASLPIPKRTCRRDGPLPHMDPNAMAIMHDINGALRLAKTRLMMAANPYTL
jgi:hypothetical protein